MEANERPRHKIGRGDEKKRAGQAPPPRPGDEKGVVTAQPIENRGGGKKWNARTLLPAP